MFSRPLRLSSRLGISHGALAALLVVLLFVTLQGVLRMIGLITEIRERHLSNVDTEEALHRAAWKIDVSMRHGRVACAMAQSDAGLPARASIETAREALQGALLQSSQTAFQPLRAVAQRYEALATSALAAAVPCDFLLSTITEQNRAALDEEITDAWIDRLHDLHADLKSKQELARRIGVNTALGGFGVALVAAVASLAIARSTARSVSRPVAALAVAATRLGEGDFQPIPRVEGPLEVEELWRDLERARERLREVDQLKQSLLASVSHEMRSPLTSVREALALLADGTCGTLNPKQQRVVQLAKRACEREVRVVEALLDMSRLRAGQPLTLEGACDVDRVVDEAIEYERDDAQQRGVCIEVERVDHVPVVQIDSPLVESALANLIRNAVSVSKQGDVVRVVRSVKENGHGRVVAIEVIDAGPGVDESFKDSMFRPFASAPVGAVKRPAGIGLGLSFAREVARAHGGEIVLSRSGVDGTTFRFELPIPRDTLA
jgi:two-component system sensor histidine kinase GlrK